MATQEQNAQICQQCGAALAAGLRYCVHCYSPVGTTASRAHVELARKTATTHRPDPTLRSYLIDRAGPGGVDAKVLTSRLDEENEASARRAILLSLSEYRLDRLAQAQLLPRLLQLYRDNPDAGIHAAAEWLLRQWQAADELKAIDKGLATGKVEGKRQWYINGQGQTMMVVPKPGEFWMGERDERHRRQIGRSASTSRSCLTCYR
jgi:hypothetical protein